MQFEGGEVAASEVWAYPVAKSRPHDDDRAVVTHCYSVSRVGRIYRAVLVEGAYLTWQQQVFIISV